ncbi:MAG: pyruvate, phosphate dikinase [Clostridia bacterium]|nr:pyruvate, phosphate dikinase [Clostridia bacterium]
MAKKYVFNFNEGSIGDYALLGEKGANLAQITQLNLPMPFGFTISTDGCNHYFKNKSILPNDMLEQILRALKKVEEVSECKFGDTEEPLLLSVRTGASVPCRGLAKTILNVGMNDTITSHLIKNNKNPAFGLECYARFIRDYSTIVMKLDEKEFKQNELEIRKENAGLPEPDILQKLISQYKKLYKKATKTAFPQDVATQLFEAIRAGLDSWNSELAKTYRRSNMISDEIGCAVSVQQMVFGNYDISSGVGVAHTRNPISGEKEVTGEMLRQAQEKSGLLLNYTYDMTELKKENPAVHLELTNACKKIEDYYQDLKSIEFCVQSGKLYIMQVEDAVRSPMASVKLAVDMAKERVFNKNQALMSIDADGIKTLMQPTCDEMRLKGSRSLAEGVCGYPGCACGVIALSSASALLYAGAGHDVILIQEALNPQDADAIAVSSGLVTLQSGYNSYASVIARNKSIPCIIGAKRLTFNETTHVVKLGGMNYKEGDYITINAETGKIYGEKLPLTEPKIEGDLATVIVWAKTKQSISVYADADSPQKIKRGLELGADGVGLVRTENMFYQADRLTALRKFLLAPNGKIRENAEKSILKYQTADMIKIFEQSGDKEINIRLIDATLNEFIPTTQNELRMLAKDMGIPFDEIKPIYNDLKQSNPILGIRGCRMLIMHPEFAQIQVTAIINAALETKRRTGKLPTLQFLVPMVAILPEFEILASIINKTANEILKSSKIKVPYKIGCMLETPRACLIADKIAENADFVCFGTNDLTQLTFGFSSDDCMKFLQDYYDDNLIYADPFETMDKNGVFELINLAVEKIRKIKPNMPIWLLGDMVADPNSLKLAMDIKINKISCVPNKIPSVMIAQAQAVIDKE